MNTKFKLINGNIFSIPLEQDMTIEEVKDIIRNQKGYDDGEIVLIFKANKLRDYQILRKLRYKPEDTIFIHKKKSKRENKILNMEEMTININSKIFNMEEMTINIDNKFHHKITNHLLEEMKIYHLKKIFRMLLNVQVLIYLLQKLH